MRGRESSPRELPPIGCYVKDEYAHQFQVQTGAGDPFYKGGRRRSWFLFFFITLLISGGLVFGFYRHMEAGEELVGKLTAFADRALELVKFPIEQVHIAGHKQTKEQTIIEKLGPVWDHSLLTLNTSLAQKRIESLPWVKEAIVERVFPQGLNVLVVERKPIGRWVTLNGRFVFDAEGVLIEQVKVGDHLDLPIYEGKGAPKAAFELQATLSQFDDLASHFVRYQWVDERRWSLILKDGMQVYLPATAISRGLSRLRALQVQYDILGRDLAFIDLRLDDRVTIRPKRSGKIKVLSTLEDLGQTGKINADSRVSGEDGI